MLVVAIHRVQWWWPLTYGGGDGLVCGDCGCGRRHMLVVVVHRVVVAIRRVVVLVVAIEWPLTH